MTRRVGYGLLMGLAGLLLAWALWAPVPPAAPATWGPPTYPFAFAGRPTPTPTPTPARKDVP